MTPEEQLAHLKTVLSNIAAIDDGNINALLKANRVADDALRALRPRKKVQIIVEFKADLGDIDGVSDAHHAAIGTAIDILSSDKRGPYIKSIEVGNCTFETFDPSDPLNWS